MNIKCRRIGKALNSQNKFVGNIDRVWFVDNKKVCYEINGENISMTFENTSQLLGYLKEMNYRFA